MDPLLLTPSKQVITRAPDLLILDTADHAKRFLSRTRLYLAVDPIEVLDKIKEKLATAVLEAIYFERDALFHLSYNSLEMMYDVQEHYKESCLSDLTDDIYAFGESIFTQLQDRAAYKQGYLFYQYGQWIDSDLVLQRLVFDNL